MIAAIYEAVFFGLLGLFFAGMAGALLFIVWRASRYMLRLEVKRHYYAARHARLATLRLIQQREDVDEQARILTRVRVRDELAQIRAEILASENETPLHLVAP